MISTWWHYKLRHTQTLTRQLNLLWGIQLEIKLFWVWACIASFQISIWSRKTYQRVALWAAVGVSHALCPQWMKGVMQQLQFRTQVLKPSLQDIGLWKWLGVICSANQTQAHQIERPNALYLGEFLNQSSPWPAGGWCLHGLPELVLGQCRRSCSDVILGMVAASSEAVSRQPSAGGIRLPPIAAFW